MLKLKHSLLLLLVLFLAACGSQAELPSAVPSDQAAIGQISAADLEQALAEGNLTAQTYWNKKKFNKFILKKVVIGHGPEHQEYAVGVVCEAPSKHGKPYLKAAYLEGGESLHFYVPKYYTKCVAFEAKTYGDHVWFTFQNNQYKPQKSEVTFENEHLKASKVFYVKPGLAKFTVYNKYDPKPQPKPLDIYVKKFFKDHYGNDVHIGDQYHVTLTLVCGDVRQDLTFGSNTLEDASGLLGKTCHIEEKFGDDKYHTVYIKGSYQNYKHYYKGSKGEFKGECEAGHEGYDYCKAGYIKVDKHSTKLVLVIVDIVKEKYEPKKLTINVLKRFSLSKDETPLPDGTAPTGISPSDVNLTLVCEGSDPIAFTLDSTFRATVHAYGLQGKNCHITEELSLSDKYQLQLVAFDARNPSDNSATYSRDSTAPYMSDTFMIDHDQETLNLTAKNMLKQKLAVKLNKKFTFPKPPSHLEATSNTTPPPPPPPYEPSSDDFEIALACDVNGTYVFGDLTYDPSKKEFNGSATLYTYRDDTCVVTEEWKNADHELASVAFYLTRNDGSPLYEFDTMAPYMSDQVTLSNSTDWLGISINNALKPKKPDHSPI